MKLLKFAYLYDIFNIIRVSHVTLILLSISASLLFDVNRKLTKVYVHVICERLRNKMYFINRHFTWLC